jgi:hypothetical protein
LSILRIVEGIINTRPTRALGSFAVEGPEAAATDKEFDLGGLRKDIHIENDQPITVKFNSAGAPGMVVVAGSWDWTGEFAKKAFVTFTAPTDFKMQANG